MAGRIQIARGSNESITTSETILPKGTPIHNTDNNYIYVANGTSPLKVLTPITSNRLYSTSYKLEYNSTKNQVLLESNKPINIAYDNTLDLLTISKDGNTGKAKIVTTGSIDAGAINGSIPIINTSTQNSDTIKFKLGKNIDEYSQKVNNVQNAINATNATNATNAIKKTDGTFAGLQLDENGVLKVGGIIIPQHKTIFKPTNPLPFEFNNNKYSVTILNLGLKEGDVVKIIVNTNTNISSVKNTYYGIIGGTQIQSGTSLSNYFGKTSYLSLYNNETENSLNIIFYLLASQEESIDEYSPSTVYSGAGAIVKSGGKYYASKQDVPPNTTPGQTSGWEAYWVQTATVPTANYLYPMSTSSVGSIVSITKIIE